MYKTIKTFEDACKALGISATVPTFDEAPEAHRKALIAHYKLIIIVQAVNEGWQPNWSDNNERKYELWPDVVSDKSKPSGFGLSCYVYVYWRTTTLVGSRLCFKSSDVAKYTFEQFKYLYEDYLLIG